MDPSDKPNYKEEENYISKRMRKLKNYIEIGMGQVEKQNILENLKEYFEKESKDVEY